VNEADWLLRGVHADMRELEEVITQGESDAEQVREMAEGDG
jgi:hypothetical protein